MPRRTRQLLAPLLCAALAACSAQRSKSGDEGGVAKKPVPRVLKTDNRSLHEIELSSYFREGDAARGYQAFADGDNQGALAAFDAALTASVDEELAPRLRLMRALTLGRLGRHDEAIAAIDRSLEELPFLSNYLHYQAARSHYFSSLYDTAMQHARQVEEDSIHGADAALLIGDIYRAQGEQQGVYDVYTNYLEERPEGIRRPEARFRLAQAALALGKADEAALQWQRVQIEAALSSWAEKSAAEIDGIRDRLSPETTKLLERPSPERLFARAGLYYRKQRSKQSEADYERLLGYEELTPEQHCEASYYRANSVYKQRNRTKAAPLFLEALDSCEDAKVADLYVKAAYQAGRSFATLGQYDKALTYYALIEKKHPEHSYADDARLLQAEVYRSLKKEKLEEEFLGTLADKYPDGDMLGEAMWRLAWRAYKKKSYGVAIQWLEKMLTTTPTGEHLWAEGQAQYWIGRAEAKRGNREAAIESYRKVIRENALNYYALLAFNRLRESAPSVFEEMKEEVAAAPADPKSGALVFEARELYGTADFARALELLRLGLHSSAAAELSRLGFKSAPGREPLTDPDAVDRAWAVAFLHHQLGNIGKALWPTRWQVQDYKRHWPEGEWKKRWLIAYPLGFWDLIQKHAKANEVEPELVISFVREESGFDPRQESHANAIGLSQLIMPTAERFAKGTGIEVSRETLRDPDKNLTIGTAFMGFLDQKWQGQITLMIPSYNAGEGAVARWVRERGNWERDAWSEEIPYDETRRYSKRVIGSYFAYRYLLHRDIPVLPLRH